MPYALLPTCLDRLTCARLPCPSPLTSTLYLWRTLVGLRLGYGSWLICDLRQRTSLHAPLADSSTPVCCRFNACCLALALPLPLRFYALPTCLASAATARRLGSLASAPYPVAYNACSLAALPSHCLLAYCSIPYGWDGRSYAHRSPLARFNTCAVPPYL